MKQARRAMRQFASSVAVLTYRHDDQAHGTTVSAVSTVSRHPLLIGVSLRDGSQFARLVAVPGQRFAVNVLASQQDRLAEWFADPARPPGLAQFGSTEWHADGYSGAPLLKNSLAWLSCRLTASICTGDHRILVAEGVHGVVGEGSPLLSFAGQLHDATLRNLQAQRAHPAGAPVPEALAG